MAFEPRVARIGDSARPSDPADEQFRMLVSSVTDYAIYMLSLGGEISSWNAGAARIKGYAAADVIGRHFSMFFTDEDRAAGRPARALETARQTGRFADEGWRVRKDGSRFWASVVIDAVRDDHGALAGFAKITRDLTQRRAAEEQVRESEARLQAFMDNSPALMSVKDREGRYRMVNAGFLERFGVTREQVTGRSDAQLFPRSLAAVLARLDAEVIAQGAPTQFEETGRDGGGESTSMVWKFPVRDAAGEITGVGAVVSDITQRKQVEQALREQRTLLAEAQKIAGLGSWEWDPASGRVTWSDELYRIYGLTPDEFSPSFEAYLERVHPEDRQQVGALVARALIDGPGFTSTERIVRPGGEVRYVRSHGEVLRSDSGRPLKMLGATLDVTEQRHAEAALRQAALDLHGLTQRLVQAEELERRRVARELHDRIGQNLSALSMNLDIMLGALEGPPAITQRLRDSAVLVDATLQSIEGVMADLRPPLLDEYGLGAALTLYAAEFERRSAIHVEVKETDAEAVKRLRPDVAVALFRIAQEALNNVLKHSRASQVYIEIAPADGEMTLLVRDDGVGFDPVAAGKGRWGMGTMRERAAAAGGSLELRSAPGQGAALLARVPRPKPEVKP